MNEPMKTDAKKEGKAVKVKYNGTGAWAISNPRTGTRMMGPGDEHTLRLNDKHDLHALLQILKQMNEPAVNVSEYLDKRGRGQRTFQRHRFEIAEGEANIPKVLRSLQFRPTPGYLEAEETAIKEICPDFFKPDERPR